MDREANQTLAAEVWELYQANREQWEDMIDKAIAQESQQDEGAIKAERLGIEAKRPREEVLPDLYMRLAIAHDLVRQGKGFKLILDGRTIPKRGYWTELNCQNPPNAPKFSGYGNDELQQALLAVKQDLALVSSESGGKPVPFFLAAKLPKWYVSGRHGEILLRICSGKDDDDFADVDIVSYEETDRVFFEAGSKDEAKAIKDQCEKEFSKPFRNFARPKFAMCDTTFLSKTDITAHGLAINNLSILAPKSEDELKKASTLERELVDFYRKAKQVHNEYMRRFGEVKEAPIPPCGTNGESGLKDEGKVTSWIDVKARLLRMCESGEPYTSQRELGAKLDCSEFTINKAVNDSVKLKNWMKGAKTPSPRAQSFNQIIADNTANQKGEDPSDYLPQEDVDLHMAKLINDATPEERAKMNALNPDQRRMLVKACLEQDKEKHIQENALNGNIILGRKP